jgi:hypothetical protein
MDDEPLPDTRPYYPGMHPAYDGAGHTTKAVAAALIVLALAGAGYYGWTQYRATPEAASPPLAAAPDTSLGAAPPALTASAASAPAEPTIQHPIAAADAPKAPKTAREALTPNADAALRNSLIDTLGAKAVTTWLQTDGFARRVAATVDNLGRVHAAPRLWPTVPVPGRFSVQGSGDGAQITAANAARYSGFVSFAAAIDVTRAAALYKRHYPAFQAAYQELGYPQANFNDRVVAVIDQLLATPQPAQPPPVKLVEVKGEVASTQPWTRYEFVDPQLEALPAGSKMLLRMGSDNAQRLKAKLTAFRSAIAKS